MKATGRLFEVIGVVVVVGAIAQLSTIAAAILCGLALVGLGRSMQSAPGGNG